jgi:hypothetical protein
MWNRNQIQVLKLHYNFEKPSSKKFFFKIFMKRTIIFELFKVATVGLQAKTALAMPVCPPETRKFSFYNLMLSSI